MTSSPVPTVRPSTDDRWWVRTWPLGRDEIVSLTIKLALVIAVGIVVGTLLTEWSVFGGVREFDRRTAEAFVDARTSTWDEFAHWGAFLSSTPVKIVLTAIVVVLLIRRFRSWYDAVLIGLPLVFEATAYLVTSIVVGRPRPDVPRLEDSPVDTTFPSGHVAAATVYVAFAVVVFRHTDRIAARVAAVVATVSVPLIVGLARVYQGMHYVSDVVAGVVLGAVSLAIAVRALRRPSVDEASECTPDPTQPELVGAGTTASERER